MARPRSADKHNAILEAALVEFGRRGVWATPTSAISRTAGVAEGTLFTYFASKALLTDALYRALKTELAGVMLADWPEAADPRTQFRHIWDRYVQWGVAHPGKLRVLAQLKVSDELSNESRVAGMVPFARLEAAAHECMRRGEVVERPMEFLGAMLTAMAETTVGYIAQAGDDHEAFDCAEAGFEMFWRGIAVPP
ncbi:TetR/AcrR family transcriptional regulator [Variovorax sp. 38R]|uniref:TetR/AcrR family transcriptional regulator n=1 Tax=Variovorax sp. 38R TaxID=2774875 RepID=UPI001782CCA7|nr:TetR/AcrR family transcriptional regulator [Variovorax sp. 38R]QOF76766.1 TetR/AcrR family transcriptional regulator [Variovorax sp. 38R]